MEKFDVEKTTEDDMEMIEWRCNTSLKAPPLDRRRGRVISLPVIGLSLASHSPDIVAIPYSVNVFLANYVLINIFGNWYIVRKRSSVMPCTPNFNLACRDDNGVDGDSKYCWICDKCIWKRDHHCLFLAACVGRINWGNFVAFCFQAALGASYAFFAILQYCRLHYAEVFSADFYYYVFPVTLYKWYWTGEVSSLHLGLVALLNVTSATVLGTTHLFFYHVHQALAERNVPFYDYRNGWTTLQRAFGLAWPWSLFFPARSNLLTIQQEDLMNVKSV